MTLDQQVASFGLISTSTEQVKAAILLGFFFPMCKNRRVALGPMPKPKAKRSSSTSDHPSATIATTFTGAASASFSVESLADSIGEAPSLYPYSEILTATNNFLSPRLSPSAWCCTIRGSDAVLIRCSLRSDPSSIPTRLTSLCRSHHASLARLLGASLPGDGRIYIAYEHVPGATLSSCLRNPDFTPLSSWCSRIQLAADLSHALDYIHHNSSSSHPRRQGTIHNRIKSSAVIVTEPGLRAKICHFGAAQLTGEARDDDEAPTHRIEGTRGYIAPEVLAGGRISQMSDVFALGVVLLELISGAEPLRYNVGKGGAIERVSVIETARAAYGDEEQRRGRIRMWVDRRLKDSFPEEVAEKLIRVALRCVEAEPRMRPDMVWVAGKVSRLLIDSMAWEEKDGVRPDFTVSLAPR